MCSVRTFRRFGFLLLSLLLKHSDYYFKKIKQFAMPESYSFVSSLDGTAAVGTFSTMNQVNFSGYTINNVSPAFTIGGWVRLTQQGQDVAIFASSLQFAVRIRSDGYVRATFISQPTTEVLSAVSIADNNWHYVAASFSPLQEGSGTLTVFIDGAPNGAVVTIPTSVPSTSPCTLGDEYDWPYLEIASWEIWKVAFPTDVMEVPVWGAPSMSGLGPDMSILVAAFDFASPTMTSSNPAVSFTAAGRGKVWPCLRMTNGNALPNPEIAFPIGNSGAWSILTWVKVPAAFSGQFIPYLAGGTSTPGEHPEFRIHIDMSTGASLVQVIRSVPPDNPQILLSAPYDLTSWSHIAVTFDQQVLKLYVNGTLIATSASLSLTDIFVTSAIGLSSPPGDAWSGSLQSLSIWNQELNATQITADMGWIESDSAGLVAFFPFLTDAVDTVNGVALTVSGGALTSDIQVVPGGTTVFQQPDERFIERTNCGVKNMIVQPQDYWEIAAREGIQIQARSQNEIAELDLQEWYNSPYFDVAEPTRSKLIAEFDRNFQLAKALRQRGIKTGQTEAKIENGHTVFYYHTLNEGPVEVYREEVELTPLEVWYITIVFDVLFLIFAMFGVFTTPNGIRTAMNRGRRISRLFQQIGVTLQNAPPGVSGAMVVVGNIINILNNAGTLFSIIWDIVTASWWDIIFVCVSLIISILSIIFLPASYGWRLANLGVAVGTLAYDLTQKPSSPTAETVLTQEALSQA